MRIALDLTPPTLAQARAVGEIGAQLAEQRAARETPCFRERAEALILERLAISNASGEECTDHCAASGLKFADGLALGATYASLLKRGLIVKVGECKRRRGRGTAGGSIYQLGAARP